MEEVTLPVPEAVPSRRERNKQAKLDRIKQAAWTLFTQQGFAATTIREIAEHADVATGTVFLHVSDKADLLLMVFSDAIAQRSAELFGPQRLQGPLGEVLSGLFTTFFELYRSHPGLARDFVRETLFHHGPWRDREIEQAKAFIARLAVFLSERQEAGEVRRDLDAQHFAFTLFGLYQAVLLGWLSGAFTYEEALTQLHVQFEFQTTAVLVPAVPVSPPRDSR